MDFEALAAYTTRQRELELIKSEIMALAVAIVDKMEAKADHSALVESLNNLKLRQHYLKAQQQ